MTIDCHFCPLFVYLYTMIERKLKKKLLAMAGTFPVVTITGPRQSGKTTLVKAVFPSYDYVTLEDPDIRAIALSDPRKFLSGHEQGLIIDEAQRAPELFSYIQGIVDLRDKTGQFILTGSQNFLLLEKISQTLAGRVAVLKLLPLSLDELKSSGLKLENADNLIFLGMYPRLFDKKINPADYYPFYIQTYVEKDVKLVKNIANQSTFIKFLKMCAGRTGQLLNMNELANASGIDQRTVKSWVSVLEASYIIYLLYPHHKNYNKRLIKMPKLYFYDTGLACSLLGIRNKEQLPIHFSYGSLFENFVINEFFKNAFNAAKTPDLYFWRDKSGREIDLIFEQPEKLIPIEIKAGKTFSMDFFKNLNQWNKLSGSNPENAYVIYGGDKQFSLSNGNVIGWKEINQLLKKI